MIIDLQQPDKKNIVIFIRSNLILYFMENIHTV